MSEPTFDVLVAEDERDARQFLAQSLRAHGYRVIAEVGSGRSALAAVAQTRPHAVFLDVQMPGGSGLDVARQLAGSAGPLCVFVTAYSQFALSAFDVHAVDYLLKPFDDRRLSQCCRWLRTQLVARRAGVEAGPTAQPQAGGRLVVKSAGALHFVVHDDISHITADGYCAFVHTQSRALHVRVSLATLLSQLPSHFVRVHRSTIINTRAVERLDTVAHGDAIATLRGGALVRVSRDRRHTLPPIAP